MVWQNFRSVDHDIFLFDLIAELRKRITTVPQIAEGPEDQARPAISGDVVARQDFRSGDSDIFVHLLGR